MKFKILFLILISFSLITSCDSEDTDTRKLISQPIYPNQQPDDLNNALVINGALTAGNMPLTVNPEKINITVSVPSALITNDNFLFLPFAFDVTGDLKGIYLQVEGALNHWDAPVELVNPGDNSFAVAIGIPAYIQEGDFVVSYKLYDNDNNVSERKSINVSIVASESRCGIGQGFPRVEGSDGITIKTYDFGDVAGTVNISYFMYTQKDRMDIRYNRQWVRSTSSELLNDGQAPPFKACDEASPAEGFVSGGGTFSIPYDPKISTEISIYVSGCLQGGTLWYFDVTCPDNSAPPAQTICENNTAQDSYDSTDNDYHIYPKEGDNLTTIICDPEKDTNCSISKVFNTMLKQSNFIAPTNDESAVEDCKVTWVNIITSSNPIVSKVNYSVYSVTNYTLKNQVDQFGNEKSHLLHPGKVIRTVKMQDGKVVVSTFGEGTGFNLFNINVNLAKTVWKGVDNDLKKYWDEN